MLWTFEIRYVDKYGYEKTVKSLYSTHDCRNAIVSFGMVISSKIICSSQVCVWDICDDDRE